MTDGSIWDARYFIYKRLAETGLAPSPAQTADALGWTRAGAEQAYRDLHDRHAILLQPGTFELRMANPFSGVPTGFRVHARGRTYDANCGWDAFGIPAALHADADIEAFCAGTGQPLRFTVRSGNVSGDTALIHYPLPFARWYDDLVDT